MAHTGRSLQEQEEDGLGSRDERDMQYAEESKKGFGSTPCF
jgi:hypothetical protein